MDDERRVRQDDDAPGKDNLTRVEAQERVEDHLGRHLRRRAEPPAGEVTFQSDTTVRFACSEAGATTFIDLDAVEVAEVELNGRFLDVRDTPDGASS